MKWRYVFLCTLSISIMVLANSLSAQHTMAPEKLPFTVKKNVTFIIGPPISLKDPAVRFHLPIMYRENQKLNNN
jgi:hypothetical protein